MKVTFPRMPSSTSCLPRTQCGQLRCCVPVCTTRPVSFTAFTISTPSGMECIMGFSQIHVFAGANRIDEHLLVPVIGAAYEHCIDVLAIKHLAIFELGLTPRT